MSDANIYVYPKNSIVHFTELGEDAKVAIGEWLASGGLAYSGAVHVVQSSLWEAENDESFEIYSTLNTPSGKRFVLTDIVFRSLGNEVLTGTFFLYQSGSSEMDTATLELNWEDLDLHPSGANNEPCARVGFSGGIDSQIRSGRISVYCGDVRAHPIWIDVVGYYIARNEDI